MSTSRPSRVVRLLLALALAAPRPALAGGERHFVYDDLGQLVKVIDATGTVLEYVYDLAGNLLEVRRSTAGALAIFQLSPFAGTVDSTVTLSGRGFSPIPSENRVTFGGVEAAVITASPSELVITVPAGAVTGPVEVTVGAATAVSPTPFQVLTPPRLFQLAPDVAGADATAAIPFTMTITGERLAGATFRFLPAFVPASIAVTGATVDPSGASATLSLSLAPGVLGTFVLEADGPAGRSDTRPRPGNTLEVLPGGADLDLDGLVNSHETARGTDLRRRDTDGDGINDRDEVLAGSNPTDPASLPAALFGFAASSFHLANRAVPPGFVFEPGFAVLNEVDSGATQGFAFSFGFAVSNLFVP